MIVEKIIDSNTVYHYSDLGFQICQLETGDVYDEAYDIYPCPYTYEEVYPEDDGEAISSDEVVSIIFGIDR